MDAVPARLRPDQHQAVAGALGAGAHEPVGPDQAHAHRVDQRVAGVALVEVDLASDRRDAHAVPVAAHPGDHALEVVVALGPRSESERVEQGDGARSHRDHVAEDAPHAGGRALVGLYEGGVIVGLDLEDGGQAVADVHRPRVLARPLQDARALGGQRLEVDAAGFVGAVLGPHDGEEAELGEVGLAAERPADPLVLLRGQVMTREEVGGDGGHGSL